MQKIKIAIDRGGTFCDIYAIYKDKIYTKKILSEHFAYKDANSEGMRLILKDIFGNEVGKNGERVDLERFEFVKLGTTVGTNALLERKDTPALLITTKGFGDIIKIGYQSRKELFALNPHNRDILYDQVVEVDERLDSEGNILREFDREQFIEKVRDIPRDKAVAVLFLHSYKNNIHEQKAKKLLRELGFVNISLSSEISQTIKMIDRGDTALVNAYLNQVLQRYKENIRQELKGDISKSYFMKSDGNLSGFDEFSGAYSLMSGPSGGVVALKSIYKGTPLIGFDMGGTSTDVSRYDGEIELKYSDEINGIQIVTPTVDIHTVASGGGSRLFVRDGMFVVGPESSGSNPGPICYKRDGFLSVTDANIVTGRIVPEFFPSIFGQGQNEALDRDLSLKAFEELAKNMGKSAYDIAEGFIDVANEKMANAIKEITVKKGIDVSDHILCAFGGAGGQHAVGVARILGIKKIFIHKDSGILSAIGIISSDYSQTIVKSVEKPLDDSNIDELFEEFKQDDFDEIKKSLLLRYRGNSFKIEVGEDDPEVEFEQKHRRIFGFLQEKEIVIDSIKVDLIKYFKTPQREKIENQKRSIAKSAKLYINGREQEAKLYTSAAPGEVMYGPAIIIQDSSTIVLDEASKAVVNEYGDIEIEISPLKSKQQTIREVELALYQNRFEFIATKMGDMFQRSASSVNIKERLDFSCALFDAKGNLISSAPHIPVHLGSMSEVVKAIIDKFENRFASYGTDVAYISNAPYEGGSHLPDITIVTPYIEDGKALFFVASRGHHADIGGISAGSMPSNSISLDEEGALIEAFEVLLNGEFQEDRLRAIFSESGAKKIDENISDIKAAISANRVGINELHALYVQDVDKFNYFTEQILAISQEKIEGFLKKFKESKVSEVDYLDNGAVISFSSYATEQGRAVFDFRGSSIELLSNQNTPYSVLKSAVIYSLRVMLGEDIPLNEGIILPIEIRLDNNSFLNPSKNAAVVGGNVTSSQRIVDVILRAFGYAANSQGCMNNITFGNENFGFYETIGGGSGATSSGNGADGIHTHMTNTKITDVEIIEREYPVQIMRFSIRDGSGGDGLFDGGDGLIREYRFLEDVDVSILTERRVFAPKGVKGGRDGQKGKNILIKDGITYFVPSRSSFSIKSGDKLCIYTPGGGGYGPNK